MGSTATGERPMRAGGRGSSRGGRKAGTRDKELDLLTAALLGLAVGATATLLIRRGPSGRRPLVTGLSMAGRGAHLAGVAGVGGMKAAGRAASRGLEALPLEGAGEHLREYLGAARDAIEDTVTSELRDLRKAIRRRRRRLGI